MVENILAEEVDCLVSKTKLAFLDCWAPWCKPCRDLAPVLSELDEKYKDNDDIAFFKINVDEHRGFMRQYKIRVIPCVLIYFDGRLKEIEDPDGNLKKTDRLLGRRGPQAYEAVIRQLFPQNMLS
ncbi:MAG: thioredoxin [Candidatus Thorarchaeota archaeon]|nr:thioredoxin [Candidatus Thorarchaeota archaeon]